MNGDIEGVDNPSSNIIHKNFLRFLAIDGGRIRYGIPIGNHHDSFYIQKLGISKDKFKEIIDFAVSHGYAEKINSNSNSLDTLLPINPDDIFIKITQRGLNFLKNGDKKEEKEDDIEASRTKGVHYLGNKVSADDQTSSFDDNIVGNPDNEKKEDEEEIAEKEHQDKKEYKSRSQLILDTLQNIPVIGRFVKFLVYMVNN